MHKHAAMFLVALTLIAALPALADLQNVQVGGSVRIRGNYWTSPAGPDLATGGLRWPAQPGRLVVTGAPVDWNDKGPGVSFVEQRTKLNVKADFTDSVSAFVEFDCYDWWGTEFRSNYLTGVDARGNADVSLYQAYIEAKEMWGTGLKLRVGRQELKFGSGWLIGANDAGSFFRGLSFDAVRASYATDQFSVDAVWAKLVERSPIEEDGDVDLYALYGSYLGIENVTLDAYWIWIRDARAVKDTQKGLFGEWIEDVFGVDDYQVTHLHTVGLRGAGTIGGFDFEAEAAYQFGSADAVGHQFAGAGRISPYGDQLADFDNWAGNLRVGYTFDVDVKPHVFIGGSYFGGQDNRSVNFVQWMGSLVHPFWHEKASVSFNRLFSDWQYGQFVGAADHDCTNLWLAYAGVSVNPMEKLTVILMGAHVESLADYDLPWPIWNVCGHRITPLGFFSFLDQKSDSDLCWELSLTAMYQYSADLSFEAGYSHLFLGDGAALGNFNIMNGLGNEGGTGHDDPDYFYFETKIKF